MNKDGLVTQIDCVAMLYTRYSFFLLFSPFLNIAVGFLSDYI